MNGTPGAGHYCGFFLVSHRAGTHWRSIASALERRMTHQGFAARMRRDTDAYIACLFGAQADGRVSPSRNVDCLVSAGTRIPLGTESQQMVDSVAEACGNYCRIYLETDRATFEIDPLGLYNVYHTTNHTIVCSSFLALAQTLPRLSVLTQAVYEYIIQGATYGGDTPIAEIRVADPCIRAEVVSGHVEQLDRRPLNIEPAEDDDAALDELLGMLRLRFRAIAAYSNGKVDTALSGGYDSRLMLALLLEANVRPQLHVYGSDDAPDVRIAKSIAGKMALELQHIDKSATKTGVGDPMEMAAQNFLAMDGLAGDGIFNNGADVAARRLRAASGALALNGGGGEIYRNFFYLPDKPYTVEDLVKVFYHRFDPDSFTSQFNGREYTGVLADKLAASFRDRRRDLSRNDVEWLYPYFRCRFWMGRNNSLNNRFGPALTPLVDYELALTAAGVSIRSKDFGNFEARMIRRVSPELAAFESEYGHDFRSPPPLHSRLSTLATLRRPVWIRQHTYQIKQMIRKLPFSPAPTLLAVVRDRFPAVAKRVDEYVNIQRLTDPEQAQRAASLAYLLEELRC